VAPLRIAIAAAVWWMNRGFSSYVGLIDAMVFEKLSSASGWRSHFNLLSIRNFLDTNALGIGLGARDRQASPIAVLSRFRFPALCSWPRWSLSGAA
jgi:hypothetical protein